MLADKPDQSLSTASDGQYLFLQADHAASAFKLANQVYMPQKIDTSVCLFPNNPLRDYVSEHQDGLAHAASLLAGRRGIRCVTRVVETLSCSHRLTRMPKKDLNDLLAILMLEHVHDCDRDEAGYFAEIDPADPIVEDI
jgi:hypothetical protein